MDYKNIFQLVAKQHGVTPEEVEREIKEAIRIGMTSSDPLVQARWEKIYGRGEEPSVERFLAYFLSHFIRP